MKKSSIFFLVLLSLSLIYCEDGINRTTAEPPRDLLEQRTVDNDSLLAFLNSHHYNYEEYQSAALNERVKFVIDTVGNSDKTPLINQVFEHPVQVKDADGNFIEHTMYVLNIRDGVGASPSVADSVFVHYKGMLLNGTIFDQSPKQLWLDGLGVVRGFSAALPFLERGTFSENPNTGTVDYDGFGTIAFFIPSALGYYNTPSGFIDAYSPLLFVVDLYTLAISDHDGDSVPSILEDQNNNQYFAETEDDTDGDGTPNYLDTDDDGDGILTRDEYDTDMNGIADDSDMDGTPDYLDAD